MFQFREKGDPPPLDKVCSEYGLSAQEVDTEYGVIQTDSREGLYVVMVEEGVQDRIRKKLKEKNLASDPAVGVFSNPRIEPFGPPNDKTD